MNLQSASEGQQSGSVRIVAWFKERLVRGELRIGDRVLPERELAQELSVGRPLLREVLKSLAMLGLLDIRPGSGTFIARADIRLLTDFFTFCMSQEQDVLEDVMQARIAIECQAIRLACERANESDLARIGQWLGALIETLDDPEAGGRADFMFHQSIVAASHSRSLTTLYGALSELLQQSHVERRRVTYQHRKVVGDLIAAHRQVFLSIVAKKPDEADQRLREHFAIGDELRRRSLIEAYRKGPETAQH
ncbi:MAG: FadR/GntR family transcriptional regulator [Cereibacter changlensis]|uniref:GntR family transcriptional regulator n=2 Tax=Cereibacter changlensis TaxID=402884 RepID=A0A2T4JTZ9_9RHOB|nr:FadR/GntR family transcriptional regulator [Cereibacter changlensis]PTE21356.1 GntR family transcriptional regulator [Cereibacter changlensis JA139]PZX56118.1 GntR family transcriptional regulator [Cereibacter changlensis]